MKLMERLAAEPLTPRELQVLEGLIRGLTFREIADQLGVRYEAVQKSYIRNIISKIGARNRTQAVAKIVAAGLVEVPDE